MFCSNCGKEIPNNARFCSFCGAKVVTLKENSEEYEEEIKPQLEENVVCTYCLFENELKINVSEDNSAKLRRLIKSYSKEASKEIKDKYYALGNMQEVVNHIPTVGMSILDTYIKKIINILIDNNIYNIDDNSFKEEYCKELSSSWEKVYEDAFNDYAQVAKDLQNKIDEHNELAGMRPKFVGGGFGFEGAMEGILTSAGLNIASEVIAGVINAGADIHSKQKALQELDTIYHQYRTIEKLMLGMEQVVLGLYNPLVLCLIKNGCKEYVLNNKCSLDDATLNNIKLIENKESVLFDMLNNNKFSENILNFAYENGIGDRKQIKKYADYIGAEIIPYKIISNIERMILETNYANLDEISKLKDTINFMGTKYELDVNRYCKFLDEKEESIKKQLIFVDNEEYENFNEGFSAKQKLNEVIESAESTNANDREKITFFINELENSNIKSKQKYIDYLNTKYAEAEVNAKTIFGIQLESEESAKIAKEYCKEIRNRLLNDSYDSVDELNDLKNYIELNLDGRISSNYMRRLDSLIQLYKTSLNYTDTYTNYDFKNRLEYTNVIIEGEKIYQLLATFNLRNEQFSKLYKLLNKKYVNVFGEQYSSIDIAIQKYIDLVNNANSYRKYLEDKLSSKNQGFLGQLKVGISNVVNGRHEDDYMRVTSNKTVDIPSDTVEQLNEMDSKIGIVDKVINTEKNRIESIILNDPESHSENLSMYKLYIDNFKIDEMQEIMQIKSVLKGNIIQIKSDENTKIALLDEIIKNLRMINSYYFDTKDDELEIINKIKNHVCFYVVIEKNITEIEAYAEKLNKEYGIKVGLV